MMRLETCDMDECGPSQRGREKTHLLWDLFPLVDVLPIPKVIFASGASRHMKPAKFLKLSSSGEHLFSNLLRVWLELQGIGFELGNRHRLTILENFLDDGPHVGKRAIPVNLAESEPPVLGWMRFSKHGGENQDA